MIISTEVKLAYGHGHYRQDISYNELLIQKDITL